MEHLRSMCSDAGFVAPRTCIASNNVVYSTDRGEQEVRTALEQCFHKYADKPVG